MLGVSPLPGEDKPEECPDLHQGREDEQEQIEDPFSRPKLGSDELCASDLEEEHHHSEILSGLQTQLFIIKKISFRRIKLYHRSK